ncbi:hypothetical protein [Streptomyces cyaneus]|uniref:hypothetical protein n=1 Tax=Streptomyces cyaneus TaxID=1904 RepID=UPI000FF87EB2|nr:hypothetical protein [Streptomyces cyaneus]
MVAEALRRVLCIPARAAARGSLPADDRRACTGAGSTVREVRAAARRAAGAPKPSPAGHRAGVVSI